MIQAKDDKKKENEEFKLRTLLLDFDIYMRIYVVPQIPAGFNDYRTMFWRTMDKAWHELYHAALTRGRERQKHIMALKIEMAVVEVYLKEVRDICYRGKEKKNLTESVARRYEVLAAKHKAVMSVIWGWAQNENKKMAAEKNQKTAGLVEKES